MAGLKALVLQGYGINCDYESTYAIKKVGGTADEKHINQVLNNPKTIHEYNLIFFPGGFSFGDDIASGKVLANKIRYGIGRELLTYISEGKLILGVCNGFQALVKMGLLPEPDFEQRATLVTNANGLFEDRWVRLKINQSSPSVFTKNIEYLWLPVRHGEGRFVPSTKEVMDDLVRKNLYVMQYVNEKGELGGYPFNPNGSTLNIAAVSDMSGQILGIMPHPEAYNHPTNNPFWTYKYPEQGGGLKLFENAKRYLEELG